MALACSRSFIADAEGRGPRLYARVGRADPDINPVATYFGAGAVYSMLSSAQRAHQVGFAVGNAESERNYELTYRIVVADWLALQSDVQYVRHPGMMQSLASGWAVGLRFEVGGSWAR